jgi:RHS repeat-associated protein
VYDTKNRLVSYTDPEGRTETYTYDCNSNLTKTVDKNGNILKNTYDNKNRLTERTAKEKKTGKETVHTYRYNAYGDVAVQDDTQFVYGDVSGQVTKETTKLTKNKDVVKNYTYDSNGNKSTFSVKAGEDTKLSLSYEYDGSSRLISVKDSEGNRAVSYAYDTEGSLSERQAANGLKTTYGYDYQNRLTSMTNETGKGVVSKYSSTYLKNGQKAEEVSTVMDKNGKSTKKTAAYTYDMLGRITRETKTGREDISYTYDANNNRKQMTIGNKTTAYQYNKNDELLRTDTLHTDTEKNDVVIYKNDKNGNQLATVNRSEIPAEAEDTSYIDVDVTLGDNQLNDNVVNHYNALNQLTETLTKNYKVSFTYDAEGLRTGKTVNGEKTVYVWDGDQVVMELSKGGAVQKRYIRGNDLVYADKGENTEKTYYVTDMHGNVVQLLDESGNVTKTYEYDSFGNEVKPEKKDENPYRYCGEYYDKETEEVYLRARYYEPGVGRFITRDTYTGESDEPLSLHLYTYCENDGVNAWDPSGHWGRKDGKYVHQEITKDAYENVKQSIKLQILHTDYEKILQGSIVPDYYKKKTIYLKDTICGIPLRYDNMFHGKNAKKLKKLKKIGVKKLSKRYLSGNKYIFLGCILHSIQDYFAHSYVLDLEKYKKNALEYADHPKKYQKYNSYHSDWSPYDGVEGRNVTDHQRNKDNPDMNYERVTDKNKKSYWKWVDVKTREKNKRYVKAIKESKKYINKVLKNVSTI